MPDELLGLRSADDFARAVLSDQDMETIVARLAAVPRPEALLKQLARHPSADVRAWVPWVAVRALPREAARVLLEHSLKDRDSDVRGSAVQEALAMDPRILVPLLSRIRRQLWQDDLFEPVGALWIIATLRATELLDDVRALASRSPRPWHRDVADTVVALLTGREGEVILWLRRHDHEATHWLAHAVWTIASADAIAALRACAYNRKTRRRVPPSLSSGALAAQACER